jgi:ribosomal protein S8E
MSASSSDPNAMLRTASVMELVKVDRHTTARALSSLSRIVQGYAAIRSRPGAGGLCSLVWKG